jgi:hypothetical protein
MSDIKLRGLGSSSGGLTSRDRPTLDQSAQHLAAIVEMARSRRGSSTSRSSRASTTISLRVASAVREACKKRIPSGNLAQTSSLYAKIISFISTFGSASRSPHGAVCQAHTGVSEPAAAVVSTYKSNHEVFHNSIAAGP